jgi:hypothetical protein
MKWILIPLIVYLYHDGGMSIGMSRSEVNKTIVLSTFTNLEACLNAASHIYHGQAICVAGWRP